MHRRDIHIFGECIHTSVMTPKTQTTAFGAHNTMVCTSQPLVLLLQLLTVLINGPNLQANYNNSLMFIERHLFHMASSPLFLSIISETLLHCTVENLYSAYHHNLSKSPNWTLLDTGRHEDRPTFSHGAEMCSLWHRYQQTLFSVSSSVRSSWTVLTVLYVMLSACSSSQEDQSGSGARVRVATVTGGIN